MGKKRKKKKEEANEQEDKRRSLSEVYGGAAKQKRKEVEVKGIRCPNCHCRDWRVGYTRPSENRIRRVRICRNCGKKLITFEIAQRDQE